MATLNIKNFPEALYRRLQARAERDRRSLSQEVIYLLSRAVPPPEETMPTVFSNRPGSDQDAYIAAVLGLVGERDSLEVLAATPGELRRALEPVSEEELRRPEAPGKWSLLQVAAHLADSEIAYAWRLRLILAQDRPPLTGYDQDAWADRLGYAEADLGESLALFETLRASNLRLLRRLAPEDWERVAVHAERGEESVRHMAKLYAGHDLLHLRQIDRILGER